MSWIATFLPFTEIAAISAAAATTVLSLGNVFSVWRSKRVLMKLAQRNRGLQNALIQYHADRKFDDKEMLDLQSKIEFRIDALLAEKKISSKNLKSTKDLIGNVVRLHNENFLVEMADVAARMQQKTKSSKKKLTTQPDL